MKVRNIYTDTLEIAHVDCSDAVESGETADVPDHVGESLIQQVDKWEPVKGPKADKAASKAVEATSKEKS